MTTTLPLLDELQDQEPLLSLYRARQSITDIEVLELLDSLILLITKRLIRGKMSTRDSLEMNLKGEI